MAWCLFFLVDSRNLASQPSHKMRMYMWDLQLALTNICGSSCPATVRYIMFVFERLAHLAGPRLSSHTKFACLMQRPQNSNLGGVLAGPFSKLEPCSSAHKPSISLLSASSGRRGRKSMSRGPFAWPCPPSGRPPRPMGGLSGSCVTITEGHNQRGKFAEPYSLSGQQGARFFQLF